MTTSGDRAKQLRDAHARILLDHGSGPIVFIPKPDVTSLAGFIRNGVALAHLVSRRRRSLRRLEDDRLAGRVDYASYNFRPVIPAAAAEAVSVRISRYDRGPGGPEYDAKPRRPSVSSPRVKQRRHQTREYPASMSQVPFASRWRASNGSQNYTAIRDR